MSLARAVLSGVASAKPEGAFEALAEKQSRATRRSDGLRWALTIRAGRCILLVQYWRCVLGPPIETHNVQVFSNSAMHHHSHPTASGRVVV